MADGVRKHTSVSHKFLLGHVIPEYLAEIGSDIDFVMLDTIHCLPGELLDFLCILPHLKDGAVVCVHDISLSQRVRTWPTMHATNILFHTVTADKILNFVPETMQGETLHAEFAFPNIGAFRITSETRAYVLDVFLALTLRWAYPPNGRDLTAYARKLKSSYDAHAFRIFTEAVRMNAQNFYRMPPWLFLKAKGKRIRIYGGGMLGMNAYWQLVHQGFSVVQWVDRNHAAIRDTFGLPVGDPETLLEAGADDVIYLAISSQSIQMEVTTFLMGKGYDPGQIVWLNDERLQ